MEIKNLLTIVIPCKNEENYIGKTLNSIMNQYLIKGTKVLIADANSTDNTINIIEKMQKEHHILDLNIIDGGKVSKGRNSGLNQAKTPFILFMDADTILLNKMTIYYYLKLLIDNNKDLVSAPIQCLVEEDKKATLAFELFNISNKLLSIKYPFAVGMFFLTRTNKALEYGGFDETVIHSEDFLLSKKYDKNKFIIGNIKVGQDNRRFKRFGYFNMIKMMMNGLINSDNITYFQIDNGYWK